MLLLFYLCLFASTPWYYTSWWEIWACSVCFAYFILSRCVRFWWETPQRLTEQICQCQTGYQENLVKEKWKLCCDMQLLKAILSSFPMSFGPLEGLCHPCLWFMIHCLVTQQVQVWKQPTKRFTNTGHDSFEYMPSVISGSAAQCTQRYSTSVFALHYI